MLPSAILWGTGTAIGEIPPYAVSFHATKAGQQNDAIDDVFKAREEHAGDSFLVKLVDRHESMDAQIRREVCLLLFHGH